MPENVSGPTQTKRRSERVYVVEERLVGTALYHVTARNQREALEKVRAGEGGHMIDSGVEHTGRGRAWRASEDEL